MLFQKNVLFIPALSMHDIPQYGVNIKQLKHLDEDSERLYYDLKNDTLLPALALNIGIIP